MDLHHTCCCVGHAINGIQSAGMAANEGILTNIYYFIYTFHMAAFFVLSGLLARPSVNKNKEIFFKNSLKHILYPYFLYGTIQILIMNVFSNNLNSPAPFKLSEFSNLILGAHSQFWFLKTLFFIHIAYLLSKKYSNEHVTVHLPWVRQVPGGSLAVRLSGHTRRFL